MHGPARAPHRAMYKAMGLNDLDLSRPLVAVCSTCNESTPCNIHLGKLAQLTKKELAKQVTPRSLLPLQFQTASLWAMKV